MIPDFKTFIRESAWGDMMRRGSGENIRTEDDINLLDKDGLYEYILSHYELTDNRYELTYGTANMCIPISIKGEEILLTYEFDEVHCYFNLNEYPKLYSLLQKKFNVEEMSDDDEKLSIGEHYIINPKDECTNQFYIDVIDCIIENRYTIVKKKVNESAWGDMMRRGSGEDIRTEDDVNLFDRQELVYYLKEHYRYKDSLTIIQTVADGGTIYVCLYEDTDGFDNFLMYANIDGDRHMYLSGNFKDNSESIYNEMCNEYTLTEMNDYDSLGNINIRVEPKGCRYENLTNKFFLEVLDFIIKRIKKPLTQKIYKKSMNESAWGDMMRRGSGEEIRKEDNINLLDETGLVNYMEKVYISPNNDLQIIGDDKLNFGTIMISLFEINGKYYNIIYQKISTSNPEITFPVCPDSDIEDLLRELYKVTRLKQYNDKIYKIEPNDGNKITNKFFIEVLDFILKEADGKYTILLKKI